MNFFKKLIKPFVFSLILFAFLLWLKFGQEHMFADTFSVTGLFLILFCGLIFVANEGAFDLIIWSTKKFIDLFRKTPKYLVDYQTYVALRSEKERASILPTVIVGLLYLIIGVILTFIA